MTTAASMMARAAPTMTRAMPVYPVARTVTWTGFPYGRPSAVRSCTAIVLSPPLPCTVTGTFTSWLRLSRMMTSWAAMSRRLMS
ncbi:hypothetical protein [Microtetraspora fusca]|uniref:Uncharacterized protein n=1 Tax=Microtetraspora fusca TaxID=1997 RepID=A0ABW6VDD7_MICFU|nr:hypothetical protein [Microtetraspora fusca]